MNYLQKLKDPRWQKKRLEILNRDEFACRFCYDTKSTLHVHHLQYSGEPWEAKSEHLITLCEDCHESESTTRKVYEDALLKELKLSYFRGSDLVDIANGFNKMKPFHVPDVMACVIGFALADHGIMSMLCDMYFKDLMSKTKMPDTNSEPTDDLPF